MAWHALFVYMFESLFTTNFILTDIILSGAKILDRSIQRTPIYSDSRYFPFFYRLGKQLRSKRIIQYGHQMGLVAYAFLRGSGPADWCFKAEAPATAFQNVKLAGGNVSAVVDADLVLVTSKINKEELDQAWGLLKKGFLLVDLMYDEVRESVFWFESVRNKTGETLPTFYGTRIIEKN